LKDEEDSKAAFQQLQKEGFKRYDNLPLQTKDGRTIQVEFVSNLYPEDDQAIIQCNIRDITQRKQNEEELLQAKAALLDEAAHLEGLVVDRTRDLSATNKQLEAFVYSIAHDLRAPLRAMQGFSSMLVEDAGTVLSESGRDFANRIDKSAQFMDAMLTDLLTFSQISQRNIDLASVNLEQVVGSVISQLHGEVQEMNALVESSGPWPAVLAHEPTLFQVLFNLISNALKFVEQGVQPLVRLGTEERADYIRIWVEDNGIGIDPRHQPQIFQLFTRLNGEKFSGTGFGLTIVQKGVERMGGRVGVESTPGQGSRFWLELRKDENQIEPQITQPQKSV
jgi:signal transduction histidine kinase